jgi:hypothetical protein
MNGDATGVLDRVARGIGGMDVIAMVTAGRDEGSFRFEQAALTEELRFAVAGLGTGSLRRVQVALTPLSDAGGRIAAAAAAELAALPVDIMLDHDRQAARLLPRCLLQGNRAGKWRTDGDRRWQLHRLDRQAGQQERALADQRLRP